MTAAALVDALRQVAAGRDLSAEAAESAVSEILAGAATEATIAAFLTGLHVKGETASELAGAVAAVRARVAADGLAPAPPGTIDTCGTGGDGANTVNISTATALVVAACGVPVAKHGNRSASGNSGSAEVLSELGVAIEADARVLSQCLRELGITFLFAPKFHPGLRFAGPVRKQLPFRTLFNLVGPLANPARPDHQLVGVSGIRQAELVVGALAAFETPRSAVVHAADGLDEVSLSGPTHVWLVEGRSIRPILWESAAFGLGAVDPTELRVSGPAESAAKVRDLLAGRSGPVRATVLANAAAALWVARKTGDDLKEGVALAASALDSGRAAKLLEDWRAASHAE